MRHIRTGRRKSDRNDTFLFLMSTALAASFGAGAIVFSAFVMLAG